MSKPDLETKICSGPWGWLSQTSSIHGLKLPGYLEQDGLIQDTHGNAPQIVCWAPRQHLKISDKFLGQSHSRNSSDIKDEQIPVLCSGSAPISNLGMAIKFKYFGCCFVNGWSTHSCQLSYLRPASHISTIEFCKPWLCHLYTKVQFCGVSKRTVHGLEWLLLHFKAFGRHSEDIRTALIGRVKVCLYVCM